ncbi:MAG: metallophosphoesterase [Pseudomonadota bacterium]
MLRFLRNLLGGGDASARGDGSRAKRFDGRLEIDRTTYAIGDVHGRLDRLDALLERIAADAEGAEGPARILLMGDYVDRGEQSAEVLRRIKTLLAEGHAGAEVLALRGNHEEMMLQFLDDPEGGGPRWLRNGGLQTLASFAVVGVTPEAEGEPLVAAAGRLAEAAADVVPMLRTLPAWHGFGTVWFAHAGLDPDLPPDLQSERTLVWGTPRFFQFARGDGRWAVYGHYIVDEAHAAQGRIGVDTGAYATGVLSAARIAPAPEAGAEATLTFLTSED